MTSHLVSFVGTTDIQLAHEGRGPVLTAIKELKPTSVTLIVTESKAGTSKKKSRFMEDSIRVVDAIENTFPKVSVQRWPIVLSDPTDHNEIYPKLRAIAREIATEFPEVAVAISSGTPSMQVCWILLAESGEVSLKLYRTSDPDISNVVIQPVKLEVGLPRIIGLEQQHQKLQRRTNSLEKVAFKQIRMSVPNGTIHVGAVELKLSRRQFTYYRYFLSQAAEHTGTADAGLSIRNGRIPKNFVEAIVSYDKETWPLEPDPDMLALRVGGELDVTVFRSNLSKLNRKISDALGDISALYSIQFMGRAKLRSYSLLVPASKIKIID